MERLLSLSAVARRLGVSERRVRRWVRAGQFPAPMILPDGCRRWRLSDVNGWIDALPTAELVEHEEHREPTTPEELPPLASEILRVLTAANGLWMSGEEIAKSIDESVDHTGGYFKRMIRVLRRASLVESDNKQGYRAVGP